MPSDDSVPVASLSFDTALVQLEALADQLEQGDIPLEDALRVYERAVELFGHCRARLEGVEQKLELLTRNLEGEPVVEELEQPEDSADD